MAVTIIYVSDDVKLLTLDWKMSHLLTPVPHVVRLMDISARVTYMPVNMPSCKSHEKIHKCCLATYIYI